MTKLFENREFDDFWDGSHRFGFGNHRSWFGNSSPTFSDIEFRNCHFVGCAVSVTEDIRYRSKIHHVTMRNCEQHGCMLFPAVVENTIIDGFKTNGVFQTWGAVFKHVVIQGKVGCLMTSSLIDPEPKQRHQEAFDVANANYYKDVDWALDIRDAQFEDADLRGIPANLILRDPETQFILTREKALRGEWKNLDLSGTHWKVAIEMFLTRGAENEVFVAPKRDPQFRRLLAGLWTLRDAGILEE